MFAANKKDSFAVYCVNTSTATVEVDPNFADYNFILTDGGLDDRQNPNIGYFSPPYYHSGQKKRVVRRYKVLISPKGSWPEGWEPLYLQYPSYITFTAWRGQDVRVEFPLQRVIVQPWSKVKDVSFQALESDFFLYLPKSVLPFKPSDPDDTTQGYFAIGNKLGVVSFKNIVFGGGLTPSQISTKPRTMLNYRSYFLDFPRQRFFDYVKGGKSYKKFVQNMDFSSKDLYIFEEDRVIQLSDNKISSDFVLISKGTVLITSEGGGRTFNKGVGENKAHNLIVIAKEIDFDSNLEEAYGVFIADKVNTGSNSNLGLKIKGNLVALNEFIMARAREESGNRRPALFVVFDPEPYLKLMKHISVSKLEYRQVE